jgi:hypothetical protein
VEYLRQHERGRRSRHLPLSANYKTDFEQGAGEHYAAIATRCAANAGTGNGVANWTFKAARARMNKLPLNPENVVRL